MFTVLAITLTIEATLYLGGQFRTALSRPSRRARLNLA